MIIDRLKKQLKNFISHPYTLVGATIIGYILLMVLLKNKNSDNKLVYFLSNGVGYIIVTFAILVFVAFPIIFIIGIVGKMISDQIPVRYKLPYEYVNIAVLGIIGSIIWYLAPAAIWLSISAIIKSIFKVIF